VLLRHQDHHIHYLLERLQRTLPHNPFVRVSIATRVLRACVMADEAQLKRALVELQPEVLAGIRPSPVAVCVLTNAPQLVRLLEKAGLSGAEDDFFAVKLAARFGRLELLRHFCDALRPPPPIR
jgi:hypothetical protein